MEILFSIIFGAVCFFLYSKIFRRSNSAPNNVEPLIKEAKEQEAQAGKLKEEYESAKKKFFDKHGKPSSDGPKPSA